MNDLPHNIISFAEFELDTVRRKLLRDGEVVALHGKAFDLLTYLVTNNGRVISKEDILNKVWENSFVEESNLVVQISNLRKALGETKNLPRFLLTIPGKGYKFVGDIEENSFTIETHSITELTIEQEEIKTNNLVLPGKKTPNLSWLMAGLAILSIIGFGWFWAKSYNSSPDKKVKLSKLTSSGKVVNVAMSPDGNFAVFAQKEDNGESLWLRQLETGSEKRIVEPRPLNYVGLTISPDNQFIYSSIFSKNEVDPRLEKIPLLGGSSQIIPNIDSSAAISISPDGKRFAFTDSNSKENETLLGISNIDGSDSRFLKQAKYDNRFYPIFQASPLAWSPVGDEIAVTVTEKNGNDSYDTILLVNSNDGSERYLTEKRWKSMDNIAWLDADRLAFVAKEDDSSPFQVWLISQKTGEIKQLTNQLQNYDWLATGKGKILAIQINALSSLRVADFQEKENLLKVREIFSVSDYVDELDWGKNGEIIYASKQSGKSELWQINNDGSNPKQLTTNANVSFGLSVSPKDGSIAFASQQNGIRGIWQVDSEGRNQRQISEGGDKTPDVSNDGRIVFHRGLNHAEGAYLIANGETKMLNEKCYFPSISPDSAKTACYLMDSGAGSKWRIALISNDSGELIRKIDLPVPIYERQIRWHSSGKFITQIFSEGENLKLILFPIDGGEAKIIEGLGKGESNLPEWSADGKQFLYPQITIAQDAVLLTDF